ncbi:N-acetylmuramoyl-L-alanine amidase [Gillisia sp. Hel_I_29]|uniref:N-acetylmuramoyl-L-alanine amidase family protein n=1 Tax=Gillisia sp. Hel_I_29 TaxID=1249975 RepID=UPI00054D084F|nr:N-acetylmuramoyl-L-alanine amidase [Gillisia sp. Hel_I_29]
MKNLLKNVSFVILLLKLCFIFGQENVTQKRIVIDVGHGGKDSGTIALNDIKEKTIVLKIAKELLSINKKSDAPMDIYLTRYRDTLISLSDRPKLAQNLNADFFISLHCNHSDNPKARGIEVYVGMNESRYSKESVWFAYQLQNHIKMQLGFDSRGVKFANFQVLKKMVNYCPSVLLEIGFLSNPYDNKYFMENFNITAMAKAILLLIQNL